MILHLEGGYLIPRTRALMTDPIVRLKEWFDNKARPFLEQHETNKVVELDQDLDRLLRTDRRASEELAICFLGASGVGKSTLINALVAGQENVLPAGGIGPLTALAMQVRYSEEARFEVEYQPPQNLWRLGFCLEQTFKRQQVAQPVLPAENIESAPEIDEVLAEDEADLQLDDERLQGRFDRLRQQAQKLVTDNQHADVPIPYLLDRLREVCGRNPIWGTTPNADDTVRLAAVTSMCISG